MHPIVSPFSPPFWLSFVFHFSWRILAFVVSTFALFLLLLKKKWALKRHHCEESGLLYCNLKKRQNSKWWHVSFLLNWPHSLVQTPSAIKFLGSIIFLMETKRRYKEKYYCYRKVFFFCKKICTCCAFYWPRANLFCSRWRVSRYWRVILWNSKSIFKQFLVSWLTLSWYFFLDRVSIIYFLKARAYVHFHHYYLNYN